MSRDDRQTDPLTGGVDRDEAFNPAAPVRPLRVHAHDAAVHDGARFGDELIEISGDQDRRGAGWLDCDPTCNAKGKTQNAEAKTVC